MIGLEEPFLKLKEKKGVIRPGACELNRNRSCVLFRITGHGRLVVLLNQR